MARKRLPWLAEAERIDLAVYAAVAATPTPRLDGFMRRLSEAANYSRLSLASSAVLALCGGPRGRAAAVYGLASVGVTATVVNLLIKPLGRRARPDPVASVPRVRLVRTPKSRSFPSGHTAAAVAFASGAGQQLPLAAIPLHVLAVLVGYSRVHTGVHYPGDVLGGALIGSVLAEITTGALDGRLRVPDQPQTDNPTSD